MMTQHMRTSQENVTWTIYNNNNQSIYTYSVLDARFVSSCLSWPSSARPHLSLLFANSGVSVNTLDNVKPGATLHPSLIFFFILKIETHTQFYEGAIQMRNR